MVSSHDFVYAVLALSVRGVYAVSANPNNYPPPQASTPGGASALCVRVFVRGALGKFWLVFVGS